MLNSNPALAKTFAIVICVIYLPLLLMQIAHSFLRKRPVEWIRVLSMMVIVWLIYLTMILPPLVLVIFIAILGVLVVREIYSAASHKNPENVRPFFRYYSYSTTLLIPFVFYFFPERVPMFLVLAVVILFAYPVYSQDASRALDRSARALMGLIFQTMTSHLIFIRMRPDGIALALFLFYLTNITDVGAYTFGRSFGHRHLSPNISSNKTVEGTVLATFAAIVIGVAMQQVVLREYPWYKVAILSLIIALVAQLGDLILSVFKRDVGIKDYSHLIPGQGGVLDRFDSLILCIPITYYLLSWL